MGDKTSSNKQEQGNRIQSRDYRTIPAQLLLTVSSFPVLIPDATAVFVAGARERAEVETQSCGWLNTSHHYPIGERWSPCNGSEGDRSCLSIISWSLRRHVVVFRRDQAASNMRKREVDGVAGGVVCKVLTSTHHSNLRRNIGIDRVYNNGRVPKIF